MRVILEWQCEICKDIQLSDSIRTHHMDYCRCGESAVDLEDGYQRDMGKIKEIKRTVIEEQSLPSSFRSEHEKKWATPPEDTTSEDDLKGATLEEQAKYTNWEDDLKGPNASVGV